MISQKARYAIRAMQALADHHSANRFVPLQRIATEQNIPAKYLTVILSELSRASLVATQRGKHGGYRLARPPEDIRYGDLLRLMRGSVALLPCASRFAHESCGRCVPEQECRLRALMLRVRDETAAILDGISLADPIDPGAFATDGGEIEKA